MTPILRIALSGVAGKMGQTLVRAIVDSPNCQLTCACEAPQAVILGQDAGALIGLKTGVTVTSTLTPDFDVLIDFTRPQVTLNLLEFCVQYAKPCVIGTTGFSQQDLNAIQGISSQIPILQSPNMSVGVNAMLQLLESAALLFHEGYDTEIIESHHRYKIDSPSGTALKIGEVIANARGQSLSSVGQLNRAHQQQARVEGEIGFSAVRGGDIVGTHTVLFAGDGECIEITHRSTNRQSYAQGAIRAASYLHSQKPGIYSMQDVLSTKIDSL